MVIKLVPLRADIRAVQVWSRWRSGARCRADSGFTLIETIWVMGSAGVLMAIAVWGMRTYLSASREHDTAQRIQSALRNADDRSLSEGRTYCVLFTATTWTTYVHDCTVAANEVDGTHQTGESGITVTPSFVVPSGMDPTETTSCPTSDYCAYFYPRGNALAGTVRVARDNSTKAYTVTVVGLTGRVSTS
jgi:Tfp pilus assembly protein FimT